MPVRTLTIMTILALLGVVSTEALAFTKNGESRFSSRGRALAEAEKLGLGISRSEQRIKAEIERRAKVNRSWLDERISNSLADSGTFQSYLLEVRDGRARIEEAKVLARLALYRAVQSEWPILKTTVMNRDATEEFETFSLRLKRDLERLQYLPTRKPTQGFVFESSAYGRVLVVGSSAKWALDVQSYLDGNQLEPGVEDIKIDKELGEPQEPIQGPAFAAPGRQQVVPQLRQTLPRSAPQSGGGP